MLNNQIFMKTWHLSIRTCPALRPWLHLPFACTEAPDVSSSSTTSTWPFPAACSSDVLPRPRWTHPVNMRVGDWAKNMDARYSKYRTHDSPFHKVRHHCAAWDMTYVRRALFISADAEISRPQVLLPQKSNIKHVTRPHQDGNKTIQSHKMVYVNTWPKQRVVPVDARLAHVGLCQSTSVGLV